jgi:hypothetical protein
MSSLTIITIGLVLLLAGFLLPFLMVLRVVEPGFALSFLAHTASLIGLLVVLYGTIEYVNRWREK